jgi:hypothetical protein
LARKTGQIVRGRHRWLVRVFLGRDRETRRRRYLSRTVHGPVRQAQTYLNKVLRERDLGRRVEGVTITLGEFLDRWLDTAAKPKLRDKSYHSYESLLRRYIRPVLGERILSTTTPLDVQDTYQRMIDRGLSSRTVRYRVPLSRKEENCSRARILLLTRLQASAPHTCGSSATSSTNGPWYRTRLCSSRICGNAILWDKSCRDDAPEAVISQKTSSCVVAGVQKVRSYGVDRWFTNPTICPQIPQL